MFTGNVLFINTHTYTYAHASRTRTHTHIHRKSQMRQPNSILRVVVNMEAVYIMDAMFDYGPLKTFRESGRR